jgi:hypothetical protein
MACPCCLPACSCRAIAEARGGLSSVDYSFTSDWSSGFSIGGTLEVAGADSMKTSCTASDRKDQVGGGGFTTDCQNSTYPRKDNSLTRLWIDFSYSCTAGPSLSLTAGEYIGASRNGSMIPGNFFGACYDFILAGADYFTGANGRQQNRYVLFNSAGQSGLQIANSNFNFFQTVDGTSWAQSRYPASIETTQKTFSRTLRRGSLTYTASVTLHFNNLP